ncbi:GNAT family N-acetyltransferase [Niallia taxi]|uniref:GNAT family N-acetyltransferase n=1 Tax=Niallia taxi TaxID=2499688 RepID=UPI0023A95B3F|nr:GNAT family N-acetyltransferase [Niallia taxi]MDE5053126.1 GNAT family N-acetyltransferase [Niallia taxi]MED3963546.1 GNAT family N-acetyltransferase [Niallia taxi]
MKVNTEGMQFKNKNETFYIRTAKEKDAQSLSALRLQIDGETENLDRVKGEGYLDEQAFIKVIARDSNAKNNLFLVVESKGKLVGFSRCEGSDFKRISHKAEFGVCVLKEYWGYGIGGMLLKNSIDWAERIGLKKLSLHVLELNQNAIRLYKKHGFEVEGILKNDKLLADGCYYNTIVMARHT